MFDFDATVNTAVNGVFGEPLTYQPVSGGRSFTVQGTFTDAYKIQFQDGEGGVGWTTTSPFVGVRESDFASPPQKNDVITRVKNGQRYLLFDKRADGIGWLNLILKTTA